MQLCPALSLHLFDSRPWVCQSLDGTVVGHLIADFQLCDPKEILSGACRGSRQPVGFTFFLGDDSQDFCIPPVDHLQVISANLRSNRDVRNKCHSVLQLAKLFFKQFYSGLGFVESAFVGPLPISLPRGQTLPFCLPPPVPAGAVLISALIGCFLLTVIGLIKQHLILM